VRARRHERGGDAPSCQSAPRPIGSTRADRLPHRPVDRTVAHRGDRRTERVRPEAGAAPRARRHRRGDLRGERPLLIAAGTLGIGTLVRYVPWLLVALTWGGVAYLLWFAYRSFRSAMHPQGLSSGGDAGRRSIIATALALTYLNPHVYLDTVVMLGTLATQQDGGRWVFAAGAGTGSIVWFTALGLRRQGPVETSRPPQHVARRRHPRRAHHAGRRCTRWRSRSSDPGSGRCVTNGGGTWNGSVSPRSSGS
jgi:hypothetical protein